MANGQGYSFSTNVSLSLRNFIKENHLLTFSLLRMSRNALSLPFTYQLGVNFSLDEGYFDMKVNEGRNFK